MQQSLPPFNESGYLPVGIWLCTLAELEVRFGFTPRRQELLEKLRQFVELAKEASVLRSLIGGSFVTDNAGPNDLDILVVLPSGYNTQRPEWRAVRDHESELEVHLFEIEEHETELLSDYLDLFGHDRLLRPKGIVEVLL